MTEDSLEENVILIVLENVSKNLLLLLTLSRCTLEKCLYVKAYPLLSDSLSLHFQIKVSGCHFDFGTCELSLETTKRFAMKFLVTVIF